VIGLVAFTVGTVGFVLTELNGSTRLFAVDPGMGRGLASAVFVAIACYIGLNGFTYYNSLYLQEVRGLEPLVAGLIVTPVTVLTIGLSPLSGYLTGRWGNRLPAVIACSFIAVSLAALAFFVNPHTPFGVLIACYAVLGIGYGVINPPLANASVSSMPAHASGVAAATTSTARQIGTSLGISLIGVIVYGSIPLAQQSPHDGRYSASGGLAFTSGLSIGWGVAAVIVAIAVAAAVWGFRGAVARGLPDTALAATASD
jgi:MFS family permease